MGQEVNFSILCRKFFKELKNSKISIGAKFLVLRYQKNSRKTPNARFELHTFFLPSRDPVRSSRGPQMAEAHDNCHIRFSKNMPFSRMVRIWGCQTEMRTTFQEHVPTYPYVFLWLFGYVFNVFFSKKIFSGSGHPPPTHLTAKLRRPFLDFRQKNAQKMGKKGEKKPKIIKNRPKIGQITPKSILKCF